MLSARWWISGHPHRSGFYGRNQLRPHRHRRELGAELGMLFLLFLGLKTGAFRASVSINWTSTNNRIEPLLFFSLFIYFLERARVCVYMCVYDFNVIRKMLWKSARQGRKISYMKIVFRTRHEREIQRSICLILTIYRTASPRLVHGTCSLAKAPLAPMACNRLCGRAVAAHIHCVCGENICW